MLHVFLSRVLMSEVLVLRVPELEMPLSQWLALEVQLIKVLASGVSV